MFKLSENRRTLEREREIGLSANKFVIARQSYLYFGIIPICLILSVFGTSVSYAVELEGTEGMTEMQVISTLKKDIQKLDEEIATCNRKRKGWTAATIVGGVGVVGTGVAALVQNSNRKEKKSEIEKVSGQISSTQQQIDSTK